jgi:hypothetical protein
MSIPTFSRITLLFFGEQYRRLNVDTQKQEKGIQKQPSKQKDYICCYRVTLADED